MPQMRDLVILCGFILLTACAGPATPMGGVWAVTPSQVKSHGSDSLYALFKRLDLTQSGAPKIQITPSRQILHGPSPLRLVITDPSGDLTHYDLRVRYNGYDVSHTFVRQSKFEQNWEKRTLIIEKPAMRLSDMTDHTIEFLYKNAKGAQAYARYEPPLCYAFRPRVVHNTADFKPSSQLVSVIEKAANQDGFNPSFFTALVAQESGFSSDRVSWARAIGLTQITPVAEEEIARVFSDWPRYPGINEMTLGRMRWLISRGRINARNEWRLDAEQSIRGGVTYAKMLADKWSTPERLKQIKVLFDDPEVAHTELILASYHSGFSRVLGALESRGRNWLKAPELMEARKYVNRIFSYCNYFGDEEVEKEYARAS